MLWLLLYAVFARRTSVSEICPVHPVSQDMLPVLLTSVPLFSLHIYEEPAEEEYFLFR